MQKKPGDGEQFVLGLFQKLQILRTQCVIHKGRRGFMGQFQPKPNLFFLHKTLAGMQALLQVTRIFEQKRRKEGRKEMSDVHCTCVCLFVALVFSLLPLY